MKLDGQVAEAHVVDAVRRAAPWDEEGPYRGAQLLVQYRTLTVLRWIALPAAAALLGVGGMMFLLGEAAAAATLMAAIAALALSLAAQFGRREALTLVGAVRLLRRHGWSPPETDAQAAASTEAPAAGR